MTAARRDREKVAQLWRWAESRGWTVTHDVDVHEVARRWGWEGRKARLVTLIAEAPDRSAAIAYCRDSGDDGQWDSTACIVHEGDRLVRVAQRGWLPERTLSLLLRSTIEANPPREAP